jgi:hypothetical protein
VESEFFDIKTYEKNGDLLYNEKMELTKER